MASTGYSAWAVTSGEQPTTAYWNILGENDASFNSGAGFNDGVIQSRHLPVGLANKGFWQRTTNATTGAPGGTPVAWNGFGSTYTFVATFGRTYEIFMSEPTMGTGVGANWDIFFQVNINGSQVQQLHYSYPSTGTGFAMYLTTYWQATFSGNASMTITMTNDGNPGGSFTMGATATAPAQLVVNELA